MSPAQKNIELALCLKGQYHVRTAHFVLAKIKLFLEGIFNVMCYFVAKGKEICQS